MTSRFDYVKYDDVAMAKQAKLKVAAQKVEAAIMALHEAADEFDGLICAELIETHGKLDDEGDEDQVEKARDELSEAVPGEDAIQRLEQAYMWCGKALRDEQIKRNGSAPLEEGRSNG